MKRILLCAAAALALAACEQPTDTAVNEPTIGAGPDVATLGEPETPATLGAENNAIPDPLSDSEFVRLAKLANQAEINTSRMALEKTQDPEVRAFAQRMIDDHTRLGQRMEQVAAAVPNLGESTQGMDPLATDVVMARLRQARDGAEFDREYKIAQMQAHEWTIELFEEASSQDALNQGLKALADETLPSLRQHLEAVQALEINLEGSGAAPTMPPSADTEIR